MADPRPQSDCLLVVAIFSRHSGAFEWAETKLESAFGPACLTSLPYSFVQTKYYEKTMGIGLIKRFLAFERLVGPDFLPEAKLLTNQLECELAHSGCYPEPRPMNLDPGLLTLGKFQLATTKDQGHRIYLRDGIFAEVTLRFQAGQFEPWPWTYADYRLDCVRSFLSLARDYYRQALRNCQMR